MHTWVSGWGGRVGLLRQKAVHLGGPCAAQNKQKESNGAVHISHKLCAYKLIHTEKALTSKGA